MQAAVVLLLVATAGATELCTVSGVGVGVCISTSSCASYGGTSTPHLCPGATDIQCCTHILCDGQQGLCEQTSECNGEVVTGHCPGPTTFACCERMPCGAGSKGKCGPRSQCNNGTVIAGECPAGTGFVCCEGGSGPTPSGRGAKVVAAAQAMVGKYPYSWGGGGNSGATKGKIEPEGPKCDDRQVVGFDCSGLSKYAVYQATSKSLGHGATMQWNSAEGTKIAYSDAQPGDLLFYSKKDGSCCEHVTVFKEKGKMIEAKGHDSHCKGLPVMVSDIRTNYLMPHVKRFW